MYVISLVPESRTQCRGSFGVFFRYLLEYLVVKPIRRSKCTPKKYKNSRAKISPYKHSHERYLCVPTS
jgi:hypothetical protein